MMNIDYAGCKADHVITWEEFRTEWLEHHIERCHDFSPGGFLFDEGGVYGFDNTTVGFKTQADRDRYNEWLRERNATCRQSEN